MALLDVIITHYNEPWSDGRKMFEMLKVQRGVKEGDFRVILVQDGQDETLDLERILKVYPFVEQLVQIPKSGVSTARNMGLDCAEAEWVMFCDFDDCLYAVDSMNRILESIREAGDRADILYSDLYIEMRATDGHWFRKKRGMNRVFIHGKCWRRAFLLEHVIRFDEELTYSEDALFNEIADIETTPSRIAKMPEPVYMWCYRPESLSNYTGGDAARNLSLYEKRKRLVDAYVQRGKYYDAKCATLRMLLEYYFELNGKDDTPGHSYDEWVELIRREVVARFPRAVYDVSPYDREKILEITKKDAEIKKQIRDGMMDLGAWLYHIGAIRKEDAKLCVEKEPGKKG